MCMFLSIRPYMHACSALKREREREGENGSIVVVERWLHNGAEKGVSAIETERKPLNLTLCSLLDSTNSVTRNGEDCVCACMRKNCGVFPIRAAIYMTWFPKYFLDALFSQGNGKPFVSASWICHIASACTALIYGTDIHSSFIRGGVT